MLRGNHMQRLLLFAATGIAAMFVLANIGVGCMYRGRALPHTYIGQSNVGGESLSTLKMLSSSDILPAQLTFAHGSLQTTRTPADMGITVDTTASLQNLDKLHHWLPLLNLIGTHHAHLDLQVGQTRFNTASKSLAGQLTTPALGRHIGLSGTTFVVKSAENGFRLDTNALLTPTLNALQRGAAQVRVPTIPIAAPTSTTANLAGQIPQLQKELDTPISFVYQGKTVKPSKAERSHWFVPSGASMAPSLAAIRPYIVQLSPQLVNPDNLGMGVTYAVSKAEPHTFAVVISSDDTVIRTYCTAVKDVNASVLADLDGKLAMTYNDERGWNDGGKIAFEQVTSGCQYTVWMSAAKDMTSFGSICDDYYNCQVGAGVVLNYNRWTTATPPWNKTGGNIQDYRTLMIDHETGHRLGFYDNPTCPGPGQPAPVMMQQSIDLHGCVFNIWPRPYEFTQLDQMLDIGQTTSVTNLR